MRSKHRKKRKLKKTFKILLIVLLIAIVAGISCYSYVSLNKKEEPKKEEKKVEKKKEEKYTASMIMVGDCLIHSSVYSDARTSNGGYDFKKMLENVKPLIKQYDLAYYNQETILGGKELGLSTYPQFNSPYEVGDAFLDAGFNMVSLANNHSMDRGTQALDNSIQYWKKQKDVYWAGTYSSFEERDTAKIGEKNGIKYAMLSYTTVDNGLPAPKGQEYYVNAYSDELAKADIERVRDKVDVVMVAMHWGTEYNEGGIDEEQTRIAKYLSDLGVDIIIGAHPHVIEPIEYVGKTLVIYSLGNFLSGQINVENITGLMVGLNINKTVKDGKTTIDISDITAEFVYTDFTPSYTNFKLYRYNQLTNDIFYGYKDYYSRWKKDLGNPDFVKVIE